MDKTLLFKGLINEKEGDGLTVGTVTSLSPLKVKIYSTDGEIEVVSITGLSDVALNKRVLMIKYGNQYVALGVLGEASASGGSSSPSGSVISFAGSSAPSGWLICDGSAISRTTYATLYAVIGTTYGVGDGSTTFNLPNIKGKVPVGYNSSESEFNTLGETGGAKTHTLTTSQMPTHTHTQNSHGHTQNSHDHTQDSHNHSIRYKGFNITPNTSGYYVLRRNDPSDSYDGTDTDAGMSKTANNQSTTATNQSTTATNQNTGSGSSHNNLQPYIALNYIIKS